jgi:glycosyltransferase involved in cell wall biosynthesis
MDRIKELDFGRRVIFTGEIAEDDLPSIYNGADLLILPSLYEGFGLILPEAMASGTPVVESRMSQFSKFSAMSGGFFDP